MLSAVSKRWRNHLAVFLALATVLTGITLPAPSTGQAAIQRVVRPMLAPITKQIGQRAYSIPGLYNPDGLKRWREGLAEVGVRRDGTGLGGVDALFIGDSFWAYDAYSHRSDTTVAIVRNILQERYNPVMRSDGSRYGGAGYIPVFGGDSGVWTTADPKDGSLISDACASYDGGTISWLDTNWQFLRMSNNGTNTTRIRWTFPGSGTYAIRNRDRITDAEPIATQAINYGTLRTATGTSDAFVALASSTGTINANAATYRGKHWGHPTGWSGLTATDTNIVQIGAPASGTVFNDVQGILAYCDDRDKGVRVHAITNPAVRLADWYTAGSATPSEYITGLINGFCASAPGSALAGATRTKIIACNLLLNDVAQHNGTTFTPAIFQSQVAALVASARSAPSRPCVFWVIPPAGTNATRIANYPAYIAAIKAVMAANMDIMCVFDLGEYLGDGVSGANAGSSYANLFTLLGISKNDGSHMNNLGHTWLGNLLGQIL